MKARKLPVEVEVFQLTEVTRMDNSSWPTWMHEAWNKDERSIGAVYPLFRHSKNGPLLIRTLEGEHKADIGDYIIQGVVGELYPCKAEVFNLTYEVVK